MKSAIRARQPGINSNLLRSVQRYGAEGGLNSDTLFFAVFTADF
jgi:hypothetical protein